MHFQDCFTGQRVVHKENGKAATIRKVHSNGEVDLDFDNGSTARIHARALVPAGAVDSSAQPAAGGPMRSCPQCAAKMPASETTCPACGFEYGVRKRRGSGGLARTLIIVIVLAAIGYAVWKFVLHEKLPGQ